MDATQVLVFLLAAVVLGWFAFGVIWNLRRGNAVLRWMQAGLPRLGERTKLRWLGSSVVELDLDRPRAPFRHVQLLVVLEPRDIPWFWALARLHRRRDTLIVRAQLQKAPAYEYDLLAPGSWSERETVQRLAGREWTSEPLEDLTFRAPHPTRSLSRQVAPRMAQAARAIHPVIWRLSSRRDRPHLEVHLPLPDPRREGAIAWFDALRALAEQFSGRPA